ncbi:hypothetical protein D3C71_1845230 [compost metagenome]
MLLAALARSGRRRGHHLFFNRAFVRKLPAGHMLNCIRCVGNGFKAFIRDFLFTDDTDPICAFFHPLQRSFDIIQLISERIINAEITASFKGFGA